ncbi:hypothetical protein [Gloeobacter violaceus]|uniref:hypothetical protein n=1 Tax=Gloeobacter violaceus TaxID=33072 RepID=UPI0002EDA6FD|nr:hypothetical protein [Gloeobacter violaceus]
MGLFLAVLLPAAFLIDGYRRFAPDLFDARRQAALSAMLWLVLLAGMLVWIMLWLEAVFGLP